MDYGAVLSARLIGNVVYEGGNATQYVCAGWTRTGCAPASGTSTNTGSSRYERCDHRLALADQRFSERRRRRWRQRGYGKRLAGEGRLRDHYGHCRRALRFRTLGRDTNDAVSIRNHATFVLKPRARPVTAVFAPQRYTADHRRAAIRHSRSHDRRYTNALNTVLRCVISGSPIETPQATQLVCVGWTGTGSAAGIGQLHGHGLRLTTNSTLDWRWVTNFWLTVATDGTGTVDATAGWRRREAT